MARYILYLSLITYLSTVCSWLSHSTELHGSQKQGDNFFITLSSTT